MSQPMVMSLLHNTAPPGRVGEAVGVRMTLVNMSQAGMPLFSGALGAALGMAPVFWAMAVLLAAGTLYTRRRG
jgi:predicted acyltransferase